MAPDHFKVHHLHDHPRDTLRIVNGRGPVHDLAVAAGRIVDANELHASCRSLDAAGGLILPAGIDLHTHVLSRGVALARHHAPWVPGPAEAAQAYARIGYGLFVDAAVPWHELTFARQGATAAHPVEARWLWELDADDEHAAGDPGWLGQRLHDSQALGVKLVLPVDLGLDAARARIERVAHALAQLDASVKLHVHGPALGQPGNAEITAELIRRLDGLPVHLAHVQFHAYARTPRGRHASGAETIAQALDQADTITADAGCISFGPAMMVSRDTALATQLGPLVHAAPLIRHGWAVLPLQYHRDNPVHAVQWATGLELMLRCQRLQRLSLSVDHPNGGSLLNLPGLLALLMDADTRQHALAQAHPAARQRTGLATLDRELTLDEALAVTRHAPAAALGLSDHGRLDVGSIANLVVTDAITAPPRTLLLAGRVVDLAGLR